MIGPVFVGIAQWSGLNAAVRHLRRRHLLTVCYHNVLPDAAVADSFLYRNTIGVARLREQIEILRSIFRIVSPEQVLAAVDGAGLPERAVLITFDDGYAGWIEEAAPLLASLGVAAVYHVCTGTVGSAAPPWYEELAWILAGWSDRVLPLPDGSSLATERWDDARRGGVLRRISAYCKAESDEERVRYLAVLRQGRWEEPAPDVRAAFRKLTWEQVRRLATGGNAVGSHTVTHPILSKSEPSKVERELRDSKDCIESALGAKCPWIAYPNGRAQDVSPAIAALAGAAGYRVGFTSYGGFSRPQDTPLAMGRVCIPGRISNAAFRGLAGGLPRLLGG